MPFAPGAGLSLLILCAWRLPPSAFVRQLFPFLEPVLQPLPPPQWHALSCSLLSAIVSTSLSHVSSQPCAPSSTVSCQSDEAMSNSVADAPTVAIPWFNNIWLDDAASGHRRPTAPATTATSSSSCRGSRSRQSTHSSSRHTVSTMSAIDRISLCSLPSTVRQCSAQDILRTLSDSQSSDLINAPIPHPAVAVTLAEPEVRLALQMKLLHMRSARAKDRRTRTTSAVAASLRNTSSKGRGAITSTR